MDLTPSNLNGLFTNYSMIYSEAYKGTAPWWRELATLVTSNTTTQTYAWMDKIPKLRQWVGSRQIQNAAARSQIVTNVTFELTEALHHVENAHRVVFEGPADDAPEVLDRRVDRDSGRERVPVDDVAPPDPLESR